MGFRQQRCELNSQASASLVINRREHQRQDEEKSDRSDKTAWALSLGLVGAGFAFSAQALLAEEVKTRKVEEKRKGKSQEDRIRQHATADNVFEYFATYKVISESGKKTTMMSVRNFYNVGRLVMDDELNSML